MTSAPEAHKTAGVPAPTDDEFRAIGMTGMAREFPRSERQLAMFAAFLNVRVDQIPAPARYFANASMRDAWQRVEAVSTPSVPAVAELSGDRLPKFAASGAAHDHAWWIAVHKDAGALSKFAKWAITEGPFAGGDLSGGEVQDKAVELGLLREVSYDPAEHGESNYGLEPGDSWFVFAGPLRDGLPPPQSPGASPAGDDPKALDAEARIEDGGEVERAVLAERETCLSVIAKVRDHWRNAEKEWSSASDLRDLQSFLVGKAAKHKADFAEEIMAAIRDFARPTPVPAACKPEGETSLPGKEEGRG